MGLNHTAAMLSLEGLKTFFAPEKLVPKHFNSRLGLRNLFLMTNMAAARIRPIRYFAVNLSPYLLTVELTGAEKYVGSKVHQQNQTTNKNARAMRSSS